MSTRAVHRALAAINIDPVICLLGLLGALCSCVVNTDPLGPNSGPEGYLPKFTSTAQLEASQVFEKDGNIGIGRDPSGEAKLVVNGEMVVHGTLSTYTHSTDDPQRYVDPVNERYLATIISLTGIYARSGEVPVDNTWTGYDFTGAFSTSGFLGARIAAQWPKLGSNSTDTNLLFLTRSQDAFTEKMRITGDGNVGIGTTSPAVKLDVAGRVRVRNEGSGAHCDLIPVASGACGAGKTVMGTNNGIDLCLECAP